MVVDILQDGSPEPARVPAAARARRQLQARLARQYELLTQTLPIGPLALPFTRVKNPNQVLDDVAREEDRREKLTGRRKREDELHLPYWAELWDSSIGLAHYLVEQWVRCGREGSAVAHLAKQRALGHAPRVRVLDLGCGMGLTGATAARLGMDVLLADLETPALLFARLNSLGGTGRCRARKVNWQSDRLGETFDLILGADIVYDRSQWQFLDPFFGAHLAPGGAVLLGEPGRSSGEEFEPWIRARGWTLTRHPQTLPGREGPIWLLELRR
jgi:predicted nicotinamide N-methyase